MWYHNSMVLGSQINEKEKMACAWAITVLQPFTVFSLWMWYDWLPHDPDFLPSLLWQIVLSKGRERGTRKGRWRCRIKFSWHYHTNKSYQIVLLNEEASWWGLWMQNKLKAQSRALLVFSLNTSLAPYRKGSWWWLRKWAVNSIPLWFFVLVPTSKLTSWNPVLVSYNRRLPPVN